MAVTDSSFTSPRIRDSLAAIHQRTLELIVHGASLQDVLGALCDGIAGTAYGREEFSALAAAAAKK